MIKKIVISISFLLVIFTNNVSAQWWRIGIHDAAGALYGGGTVVGIIATFSGGAGTLTPAGWGAIGIGALLGGASASLANVKAVKAPTSPTLTFLAINPGNQLDSVGYKHNKLITAYFTIPQPVLAPKDSSVLLADGTVKIVPKKGPITNNIPLSAGSFIINADNLASEQVRYTNFVAQNKSVFNINYSMVSQANYNTIANAAMASAVNANINSVDDAVQYVGNKLSTTIKPTMKQYFLNDVKTILSYSDAGVFKNNILAIENKYISPKNIAIISAGGLSDQDRATILAFFATLRYSVAFWNN